MNNLNGYKIHTMKYGYKIHTMKWDDEQQAFYCSFLATHPRTHHMEMFISVDSLFTLWREHGDTEERRDIILNAIFTIPNDSWERSIRNVQRDLSMVTLPSIKDWQKEVVKWYTWMDTQRAFNRD